MRALASIEDFNEAFGTHFSDEEVDTIGGLVMQAFGHLPARGETIDIDGYQFKVAILTVGVLFRFMSKSRMTHPSQSWMNKTETG